jgi:Ca2+-binding EF-hand superfamily protein
VNINDLIRKVRDELHSRGARGIIGIQRKFRVIDDDKNHLLSLNEFTKAMKETNLGLSQDEISALFKYFDSDSNGSIDFEEFLQGVRVSYYFVFALLLFLIHFSSSFSQGPVSDKRKKLILLAFSMLDKNGNGELEPDELINRYDASKHPDVMRGFRTEEEILREFLETFEVGGIKDGVVTQQEFINYYTNISSSIDDDDYFELMIRNAWHISGGEGWSANSANRRVLVTHEDGRESVEEIRSDLGLKANDKEGMMSRLRNQGVKASGLSLFGGYEDTQEATNSPRARTFGQRPSTASSATGNRILGKVGDVEKPGRKSLVPRTQITFG